MDRHLNRKMKNDKKIINRWIDNKENTDIQTMLQRALIIPNCNIQEPKLKLKQKDRREINQSLSCITSFTFGWKNKKREIIKTERKRFVHFFAQHAFHIFLVSNSLCKSSLVGRVQFFLGWKIFWITVLTTSINNII